MTTTFSGDPAQGQEPAQQGTNEGQDSGRISLGGKEYSADEIQKILQRDEHAQNHIKTLEEEAKLQRDAILEYEAKTQESKSVEELLERIRNEQASAARNEGSTAPVVNVDELIDTATQKTMERLDERQRSSQEEANFKKSIDTLKETYGDKLDEVVEQRAKALNLPVSELQRLAKTSPDALVELVRGQKQGSRSAPSSASVTGIPGGQGDDLSYFWKLKKEDKNAFYAPDVQKELRRKIIDKAKNEGRLR